MAGSLAVASENVSLGFSAGSRELPQWEGRVEEPQSQGPPPQAKEIATVPS